MRAFLTSFLLLALLSGMVSAFAQDPAAVSAAEVACGPKGVNFDVKDDDSEHTSKQPEAGKALVYVIQGSRARRLSRRLHHNQDRA